jgi:hypothetical protein
VEFFNPASSSTTDDVSMIPHPPITTLAHLNLLLHRHPYFRDRPSFSKQYWHAQCYILLKAAKGADILPNTRGIDPAVIRYWRENRHPSRLLYSLHIHEQARRHHEAKLPPEHYSYRIDPSTIYESIRPLKTHPHTPDTLAHAIETLYHKVEPKRFLIADLKPYHESGPRWTRTVAKSIEHHREEVETLLNQKINLKNNPHHELRLAIDNHTLYLWQRNSNPDHWLNLLSHEYFYFDTMDIKTLLIKDAAKYLNATKTALSRLTIQLTDHKGELNNPKSRLGDYSMYRTHLTGETLHLLLDATGHDFKDVQIFVTRLGRDAQGDGRGGIHNPIFLEGTERDKLRARLTAIALSDGHIHHKTKQFTYIEKASERRDYVRTLVKQLGDVYIAEEQTPGAYRLNMPVVVGRLLEKWDIPPGDKHLSPQYRLPEVIRRGSEQVKCAYLAEVIPEDGYFHTYGRAKFGIKRAQILNAGPKAESYNFKSQISPELQQFIKQHGEKRIQHIRDEPPREETVLVWGKIKKLEKSITLQIRDAAKQLRETIEKNLCQLLEDEIMLLKSLGISMTKKPKEIHLQSSERISVMWETYTTKEEDALRWAQLALPASKPKRNRVENWLEKQANSNATSPGSSE